MIRSCQHPCGVTFRKPPSVVRDHPGFEFWVTAYWRFNCIKCISCTVFIVILYTYVLYFSIYIFYYHFILFKGTLTNRNNEILLTQ